MFKTKNKISKFIFLFVSICFTLLLTVSSCTQNTALSNGTSSLETISSTSKVKVGYLIFPPTITKNQSTGELGGHFITTIKDIARQSNWEVEFVETDWSGFVAALNAGRFDISIVPTFTTIPRALSVYFTQPLFFAGNSAIARKDDTRFITLESIDQPGISVAVTQGEAGDEYARANFKKAKIVEFSGSDQSLAFQAVISKRADVALGDAHATSQFVKANATKVKDLFADSPYNLTPVSWAVKQGDDILLNFLNSSLDSLDYQGKLRKWEKEAGANWLHIVRTWVTE